MSSVAVMPLKSAIQLEADSHSADQLRLRVRPRSLPLRQKSRLLAPWKTNDHDIRPSAGVFARERIGQLVRENCRVIKDKEMSQRLAALIKKIENGSPELSTEVVQAPGEKQGD